jgi:hypothetical protein
MKGKHCEFTKLKNGASAIACGVPDTCDHDDEGVFYYLFVDKKTREEVWISQKKVDEHFPRNKAMIGASASCSKCGALAIYCMDINVI